MKNCLLKRYEQTNINGSRLSAATALFVAIFLFGCNPDQSETVVGDGEVTPDTLRTDTFPILIDTEAGLFANPVEIVHVEDDRFAVLDFSQNVVKVLNMDGDEMFQFGGEGGGPGEWTDATNYLNFADGRFLVTDVSGLRLNMYDSEGTPLTPLGVENWGRYSSKHLMDESTLLLGTNGYEETLALRMDLEDPDGAPLKIGLPELPPPVGMTDLGQVSQAIANGEVPARVINETVLTAGNGGYYLFMNALGELRFYGEDGVMEWSVDMPESAKTALHEYFIERNENAPPAAYAGIEYAVGIRYSNERVYVLTIPAPDIYQHLLIYSAGGELQRHIVLDNDPDSDTAPYFGRFDILPDGTFLLPDLRNAQIVSFRL